MCFMCCTLNFCFRKAYSANICLEMLVFGIKNKSCKCLLFVYVLETNQVAVLKLYANCQYILKYTSLCHCIVITGCYNQWIMLILEYFVTGFTWQTFLKKLSSVDLICRQIVCRQSGMFYHFVTSQNRNCKKQHALEITSNWVFHITKILTSQSKHI